VGLSRKSRLLIHTAGVPQVTARTELARGAVAITRWMFHHRPRCSGRNGGGAGFRHEREIMNPSNPAWQFVGIIASLIVVAVLFRGCEG